MVCEKMKGGREGIRMDIPELPETPPGAKIHPRSPVIVNAASSCQRIHPAAVWLPYRP